MDSKLDSSKTIRMELTGGLGNQLFGYFAGKSLAAKTHSGLILDGSLIDLKRTSFCLDSFAIEREIDYSRRDSFSKRLWFRSQRSLNRRMPGLTSKTQDITGIIYDAGYGKNVEHILASHRSNLTFSGYFQDPRYFLNLAAEDSELKLVEPSAWFQSMLDEIGRFDTIAIHLRFGDFLENVESIGVLGPSYFAAALDALQFDSQVRKWVFSDDLQRARHLLRNIDSKQFSYIRCPESGDPAESLVLMSKARALVTANSTFSLWSALLSSPNTPIVVPEVFHRGSGHKIANLPSTWNAIPSIWADRASLGLSNE